MWFSVASFLDPSFRSLVLRLGKYADAHPMELWQLRDDDCHHSHEVDDEISQIVVSVMRAEQKEHYWHGQKELLGRRVLIAIVDLFPHIEVVVGPSVELERYASDVMEHEVGTGHVGDVGQCPREFLCDAWYDIEQDFEAYYQNWMNCPRS